jgi:uncharacterized membrane protein YGL010W
VGYKHSSRHLLCCTRAVLAAVGVSLLAMTPCLPLPPKHIFLLVELLGLAAVLQLLTMVACVIDVCQWHSQWLGDQEYESQRAHLSDGGMASIVAVFFYLGATYSTFQFYREVSPELENNHEEQTNKKNRSSDNAPLVQPTSSQPDIAPQSDTSEDAV